MKVNIIRLKIILLILFTNILLFINLFFIKSIIFLPILIIIFRNKLLKDYFKWIKSLSPVLLMIFFFQLVNFSGVDFSTTNIIFGIMSIFRIVIITSLAFLFIFTTDLFYFTKAFSFLPKQLLIVLTISLAFFPYLKNLITRITFAQYSRGHKKSWNMIQTYKPILIPLLTKSILRSERLAISMQARGFVINN